MQTQDRVFAMRVFSHRALWNGTICRSPADWDCGATSSFRSDYCAKGMERCFHRNLYASAAPRLEINEVPGDDLFAANPSALDGQVVVFFSRRFVEPNGNLVREHEFIHGVYRIRQVVKELHGYRHHWVLEPHADDWFTIPVNLLRTPTFDRLNAFLFAFQRATLTALIEERRGEILEARGAAFSLEDEKRLAHGLDNLEAWIDAAPATPFFDTYQGRTYRAPGEMPAKPALAAAFEGALKGAKLKARAAMPPFTTAAGVVDAENPAEAPPCVDSGAAAPSVIAAAAGYIRRAIPESEASVKLASIYGDHVLRRLTLAFATKDIVILTGPPGTGKSRLAVSLLDDPGGQRRLVVPVASTWRGREDLLGYVNPVTGLFEPTAFTEFLFRAEEAWRAGDRAPRLVLFEEFNLSQPEHWLSDLLVRLEYAHDSEEDRTLDLGGSGVRGHGAQASKVFLAPSLV
ncbi:MAG TPA: hypothetical protein VH328_07560, partial [Burkholderiaceae bacterium]|nr:hypothetical protein [Burkholderiaceae bacterium]